jgi:hypothetical protein
VKDAAWRSLCRWRGELGAHDASASKLGGGGALQAGNIEPVELKQ